MGQGRASFRHRPTPDARDYGVRCPCPVAVRVEHGTRPRLPPRFHGALVRVERTERSRQGRWIPGSDRRVLRAAPSREDGEREEHIAEYHPKPRTRTWREATRIARNVTFSPLPKVRVTRDFRSLGAKNHQISVERSHQRSGTTSHTELSLELTRAKSRVPSTSTSIVFNEDIARPYGDGRNVTAVSPTPPTPPISKSAVPTVAVLPLS